MRTETKYMLGCELQSRRSLSRVLFLATQNFKGTQASSLVGTRVYKS